MATVLDLIWVRWQQVFFGKSERKDSTALPPDGQITTRAQAVIARLDRAPSIPERQ
jgi:hypothetical protein